MRIIHPGKFTNARKSPVKGRIPAKTLEVCAQVPALPSERKRIRASTQRESNLRRREKYVLRYQANSTTRRREIVGSTLDRGNPLDVFQCIQSTGCYLRAIKL